MEEDFVALSQRHGFKSADPELRRVFTENIESEIRTVVRIALLAADDQGKRMLGKEELDVAIRKIKIFPQIKM